MAKVHINKVHPVRSQNTSTSLFTNPLVKDNEKIKAVTDLALKLGCEINIVEDSIDPETIIVIKVKYRRQYVKEE